MKLTRYLGLVLGIILVSGVGFAVVSLAATPAAQAARGYRAAPGNKPRVPNSLFAQITANTDQVLTTGLAMAASTATVTPAPASTRSPTATEGQTPTTTSISDTLQAALEKNENLTQYRGELYLTEGDTVFVAWKGEGKGEPASQHYIYSDTLVKDTEVIRIGEQVYVRDANTPGAAWSLVPAEMLMQYITYTPRAVIANMLNDFSSFSRGGTATLDGLDCEIFSQGKAGAAATFAGMLTNIKTPPSEEISALFESAEAHVWLCGDGYIHQTQLTVELKEGGRGKTELKTRLYDFDQAIQITAPTNLIPFPTPTAEPTFTPQPTLAPTATPNAAQATATAQAALGVLKKSPGWGILFSDSFDEIANDWTTDSYTTDSGKGKVTKKIQDSKYIWNLRSARPIVNRELPKFDSYFSKASISVDARWLEGATSCAYGVTVQDDFTNYYYFAIRPDGIWKLARGKREAHTTDLLRGTSTAIHKNEANKLRVLALDGQILLFVNETFLGRFDPDGEGEPGVSGLVMELDQPDQACVVEFDNFEVRLPVGSEHDTVLAKGFDSQNAAKFPTGEYSDGTASGKREIDGTKYRWQLTANASSVDQWAFPETEALSDFTVSVTTHALEGPDRAESGLVIRASAPNTGYSFSLTNSGSYVFRRTENGESDTLIFPTPSDEIKTGEPNRIKVVVIGAHYDFFINDKFVDHFSDERLASGKTALQARVYDKDGQALYEFSDYELRAALPSDGAATPTPTRSVPQATATAQAAAVGREQAETWSPVLSGWDTENLADWLVTEKKREGFQYEWSIVGDKYRLAEEMTSTDGFVVYGTAPGYHTGDYYFTVDAQRISGSPEVAYGLVFGHNRDSEYTFFINDDFPVGAGSTFTLDRREGDHSEALFSYQDTTAVQKGGVNRLGVLVQDKQINLFINDQPVGSVRDDRLSSGRVGVYSIILDPARAVFEFSNFVLRVPPDTTVPTPSADEAAQLAREAQAARKTALGWNVIAQDDFSNNANAWPLDDSSPDWGPVTGQVLDGKYRWDSDLKQNIYFYEVAPKFPTVGDFYATVEGAMPSGPARHFYGMVLRVADGKYYKFRLRNDRYATLERVDPEDTKLVREMVVPAIKPGQANRLGVLARGNRFDLFVNDEWVAQVEDENLKQGQIGIMFGVDDLAPAVFEFDNFEIRAP